MSGEERAKGAYDLIGNKASANSFIQGITGIGGFPWTLAADVGAIPLIYVDMWNDIRSIYGQKGIDSQFLVDILKPLLPEVLADLVLDKMLGQIPLVGIYFNAICAKALTWRLGTLFAFLSSRGSEVPMDTVKDAVVLIRTMFPQRDMFSFKTPELRSFLELVCSVEGSAEDDFQRKVDAALDALRGN